MLRFYYTLSKLKREIQYITICSSGRPWWAGGGSAKQSALSDLGRWLVAYAVAELGEALTISRLYEAFKGEISNCQLKKLAQRVGGQRAADRAGDRDGATLGDGGAAGCGRGDQGDR